ncbi:MAG TPA: nucleoside deaminase [Polyangiaceae bacterium]|nr:nucleoside deaminase [Polyangiaceae bacterium]
MHATSGSSVVLEVPAWIDEAVRAYPGDLSGEDARVALAIALSRENVDRGGGPFGAAVFLGPRLVAAGVNLVMGSGLTIAHAEIVAIMRAQKALLEAPEGAGSLPPGAPRAGYALYASTEPCIQCFGATLWSGVDRLVCGAETSDAESIGFDEGPKPGDWVESLVSRGIAVTRGVRRAEARAVLEEYARRGGPIYGRTATTRSRT